MAYEIKVPPFGESITESTVAQWLKGDGDYVEKGELIVSLDTEKTSSDLEAEQSGILRIKAQAGQDVAIGAVIGTIEPGDKAASAASESKTSAPAPSSTEGTAATEDGPRENPPTKEGIEHETSSQPGGPLHVAAPEPQPGTAQPKDQRLPGEPVVKPAPLTPKAPRVPVSSALPGQTETREAMTRMRRTIAQHLLKAKQDTAMLTSFTEVDMSTVMELRKRHQDKFVKKHGVKLGFMSFFIKAAVEALKEFPLVNASIDGDDIVHHHFYNISVAVSTEKGLVVPVIRDADQKSFADIEKEIGDLSGRARAGKITLDELKGGTFTITNGGVFGSMLSTPLLNPPQVGILGMHNITERAVVIDGKIEVRPMMYLALSYDHRLIDGKDAVLFLVRIKDYISSPERMMLGF